MKEIEFYKVDDLNFTTQEYDYDVGMPLFWTLFRLCGTPLFSFLLEGLDGFIKEIVDGAYTKDEIKSMGTMEILAKIDKTKTIKAIDHFVQNVQPSVMMELTREILKTTWIVDDQQKRREINFKTDFKGKYGTSLKLLKTVLMLQFSSVFQGVLSGGAETSKTERVVGPVLAAR